MLDKIISTFRDIAFKIPYEYYKYLIIASIIVIAFTVAILINIFIQGKNISKVNDKILSSIGNNLKSNKEGDTTQYEKIRCKLEKLGCNYRTNNKVSPEVYLLIRILFTIIFAFIGYFLRISNVPRALVVITGAALGWEAFDLELRLRNRMDNADMSQDLKGMCDTFYIQSRVGRNIESIILSIYIQTKNKRLKKAIMELNVDLLDMSNVEEKIDNFNKKFCNEIVDRICVIIKQANKSGYSTEFFKVLSDEIKNINRIEQMEEKELLDTTILVLEVGIFIAIFVALLYMVMYDTNMGIAIW